jgi:beta-lactamase superfamily II metal-dependent hydrolase
MRFCQYREACILVFAQGTHRALLILVIAASVILFLISLAQAQGGSQATQVVNGQVVPAERPPSTTLDIYYIDTEGGKAVLFVSPAGETLLYDTGTGSDDNSDLERIMAVIRTANLQQNELDHVIVSHYHGDHVGNAAALAERLPIRHYYDHGAYSVELQPGRRAAFDTYLSIRAKAHVTVPKPGSKIGIAGLDVTIVANAKELLATPVLGIPGAGAPNVLCHSFVPRLQDSTPENYESIGAVIKFGNFTMLDLGDLTFNQERDLVCPKNLLGTNYDVYDTTRHGTDWAGSPVLVHSAAPRIAVMNNGPRKGGTAGTFTTVRSSPGFLDFWQLHYSENVPRESNSPDQFIANVDSDPPTHPAYFFKLTAWKDGSFTMTNQRTGFTKHYPGKRVAPNSPSATSGSNR